MSDYLLTEQEAQEFLSDDDNEDHYQSDTGPAWEHMWFYEYESDRIPADLSPYGPEAYGA